MTDGEIEAFMAVYEHKSLSKAAQEIFISQPSLSKKIKLLEKELGYTLFNRHQGHQKVMVTNEGEKFYLLALEYQRILAEMKSIKRQSSAQYRIASSNSLGTYLLTPAYEKFVTEHKDTQIIIQDAETDGAYKSMEKEIIDIALVASYRESKNVLSAPVFTEPMVVVCSKQVYYPPIVTLEDLKGQQEIYVTWSYAFDVWHKQTFDKDTKKQLRLEIMAQLEYFLEKNESWAFVPISVAKGLVKNPKIIKKQISFEVPNRIITYLYRPNDTNSVLHKSFLQCIKEVIVEQYPEIEMLY